MDFVGKVKELVRPEHFDSCKDGLHLIPDMYQVRYIDALQVCTDMPKAYQLLYESRFLPDRNFQRFLKFMKKMQGSQVADS